MPRKNASTASARAKVARRRIWMPEPKAFEPLAPAAEQGDRVSDLMRGLQISGQHDDRLYVMIKGKRHGVRVTGRILACWPVSMELELFPTESDR